MQLWRTDPQLTYTIYTYVLYRQYHTHYPTDLVQLKVMHQSNKLSSAENVSFRRPIRFTQLGSKLAQNVTTYNKRFQKDI